MIMIKPGSKIVELVFDSNTMKVQSIVTGFLLDYDDDVILILDDSAPYITLSLMKTSLADLEDGAYLDKHDEYLILLSRDNSYSDINYKQYDTNTSLYAETCLEFPVVIYLIDDFADISINV